MAAVLGVQFLRHGTVHLLRHGAHEPHQVGDCVLYPTADGNAVARVIWSGEASETAGLPICQGAAQPDQITGVQAELRKRAEIELVARNLIGEAGLPMKVLAVDYVTRDPGRPLAVVYYTAPCRVDFRALLGDLTRVLGCRIDLRQVGDRDAAALTCDLGVCGRTACCTTYVQQLQPAAPTGRGLPPADQGMCGRALCCIRYEECDEQV